MFSSKTCPTKTWELIALYNSQMLRSRVSNQERMDKEIKRLQEKLMKKKLEAAKRPDCRRLEWR